jgi:hypothetical protein
LATVQIILCTTTARLQHQPVADDAVVSSETITSSGSSQATTIAATSLSGNDVFWSVTTSGADVWVTFGTTPTAAAGTTWLLVDGQTLWVRATAGYKCAVINA